jgi:beta-glucosidase
LGTVPGDCPRDSDTITRVGGIDIVDNMTRVLSLRITIALWLCLASPATRSLPSTATQIDSQSFLTQAGRARMPAVDSVRIQQLLARMTLKEKVGQMTQLELGMITDGAGDAIRINPAKLRKAIVEYGVGSILNIKDQALPLDTWRQIVGQIQAAAGGTRLKIPVVYGLDSIHGANYIRGSTIFPQPLAMAATWNPQLMLEASGITAAETRAAGISWNFSPILDIGRQPLWPRLYETFGEDVHLATVMGVATVRGYQGDNPAADNHLAASLKHYVGYSFPATGHDRSPALIPELVLREYFLPTFAAGVEAGALSVMVNSAEVNGVPGHVDSFLLKDVLRGELGFDGVVVSDWEDIKKLVTVHRVAANEKGATRAAVVAGIDMSMVPTDYSFSDLLVQLVQEGAVPTARIDQAVRRILTMKARLGLFDDALRGTRAATRVGSAESRQVALRAARESIILLKNTSNALPLDDKSRVLLTGPAADSQPALNNGWTLTWMGDKADLYPRDRPTVKGALEAALGSRLTYLPGADFTKDINTDAVVAAAARADVVILCLGESSYAETPGNIDDLTLPDAQMRLAKALAATGKRIVLVLIEGRPRIIRDVAGSAHAIVLALNPGIEGGTAIADVLRGAVNPSGKLPITYPRNPNALRTYDHKAFEDQNTSFGQTAFQPQFEFGFGASYTTFAYSGLEVAPKQGGLDVPIDVTVSVRNTGTRTGAEVVELFLTDPVASVPPPVKRLKRFTKVTLTAGESRTVKFHLTRDDLSFVGRDGKRTAEPGAFIVSIGGLKQPLTRGAPR